MKKRVSKLDGKPMSVKDFLKSLDEAAERREERKRKEETLAKTHQLDGEPISPQELIEALEEAVKNEEDKKNNRAQI